MSQVSHSEFASKINRQRVSPRLTDFCYLHFRANLRTFRRFVDEVVSVNSGAGASMRRVRILDVGCGFKPWTAPLAAVTHGAYWGVDFSLEWADPEALAAAESLPFRSGIFDAVILSEVLEHTRFPDRVLNEIRRVSRDGGVVFISTPFVFPEHGAPYDFWRPTQYLFRSAFSRDNILTLNANSSSLAAALSAFGMFIESTPLRLLWGIKHTAIATLNCSALLCDWLLDHLAPRLMRTARQYTHCMPIGYSLVVRIDKGSRPVQAALPE